MSERGLMCGRRPGGCCRLKFAFTSAAAPEHKLEHKRNDFAPADQHKTLQNATGLHWLAASSFARRSFVFLGGMYCFTSLVPSLERKK